MYVFIFWWVSLTAPQPNSTVQITESAVISGGITQERVRYFNTIEECNRAQEKADKAHEHDYIMISICGGEGVMGLHGSIMPPKGVK